MPYILPKVKPLNIILNIAQKKKWWTPTILHKYYFHKKGWHVESPMIKKPGDNTFKTKTYIFILPKVGITAMWGPAFE